jgi:hypothetical protein
MKLIILFFIISFNTLALDISDLDESYPGFHDFESTSFSSVRSYLRQLFSKSVLVSGFDGFQEIQIKNSRNETIKVIKILVERAISNDQIKETVRYSFDNGNQLTFELKRVGNDLAPISDLDLLMFKFRSKDNLKSYTVSIPEFKIEYHREIEKTFEKSFFVLGFMGMNVGINTSITPKEITRDYLYFYEPMPNPHQVLSVNVNENLEYIHYSRGAGLLTPKLFFDGLNSGNKVFIGAGAAYLGMMYSIGFPEFN